MTHQNVAIARRFFAVADSGRTPVDLTSAGFSARFAGLPPMDLMMFDQFEGMMRSAFAEIRHAIDDIICEEDTVAIRLRFEAVHTGEFMGVPASDVRCSVDGAAFLRIVDGKVTRLWGFLDQMSLMRQIGGPPALVQQGSGEIQTHNA
jgi:predicted ester cyclase